MNFIRTNIVGKIICFLFALHVLNISVDPPDPDPEWVPEDLSVNEMESISEIICEQILHIDNAFPEQDDQDNTDHGAPAAFQIIPLVNTCQPLLSVIPVPNSFPIHVKTNESFYKQPTMEILSPPPNA